MNAGTLEIQLLANMARLQSDMTSAQRTVGGAMAEIQKSTASAASAFDTSTASAKASINAMMGLTDANKSASYAAQALLASLKDQIATFGMSRDQVTQYRASLLGVGDEAKALAARLEALRGSQAAFDESIKGASGHTEQFRLGTAGANRELIVLAHEMSQGNYSRFGGSMMVLAERTNAMSLIFSATGATVIGLGVAAVAVGYHLMTMSSGIDSLNNALILTNNYAGQTRDSINAMSASIQSSATGGIGKARDMLDGLASTGRFTGAELSAVGQAALRFGQLTGQSAEDVIKHFSGMSDGVIAWAENENKSRHFLTAAQYEHIKTLEEEGRVQEATMETMRRWTAVGDDSAKHMGYWAMNAKGWRDMLDAASETMRKMVFPTLDEKVTSEMAKLIQFKKDLADAKQAGDGFKAEVAVDHIKAQQKILTAAINDANNDQINAERKASEDIKNARAIAAQKDWDQKKQALKTREQLHADEVAQIRKDGAEIAATQSDIDAMVAASDAKYGTKAPDDRMAALNLALEQQKSASEQEKTLYEERLKMLDLYHTKLGMSDDDFFAGREAARQGYITSATASYNKESDLLASYDNQNSKEQDITQQRLNELFRTYKKFITDMKALGGIDAVTKLADDKKAYDDTIKAIEATGVAENKRLDEAIAKQQQHNAEIGKSKDQIDRVRQAAEDLDTERMQEGANYLKYMLATQDLDESSRKAYLLKLSYMDQEIAKRHTIAGLLNDASVREADAKAAAEAEKAWQHAAKSIEDDLTNAILDGGGRGWKRLVHDMEFAFARMVLQPIISPIANGIASLLNPTAASAQAGVGGLMGAANAANSLYNLANGGLAASIGSGISSIGGMLGSSTLSAFGSGMSGVAGGTYAGMGATVAGSETGLGALVGSGAASAGSSITAAMAAIPGWGWAALGAAAIGAWLLNSGGPIDNTRLQFTSNNAPGNISINERGNEGKTSQSYIDGFGTSAFGTFGINSTYWMNAAQPAVQDFIKTVSATDDALAGFLTATEKASVTSYLTGKVSVANTGSEDANPNATGQLDKVFGDRINNILEGVQPGLSSLISGFTGTSQALATEAGALLQYRSALKDSGQAVFGEQVTLQQIAALKTPTELTSAALARVTSEFTATNQVAQLLGKDSASAFGTVGLASEAARQQLIQFAGGADALAQKTASFSQNYFTDAERLVPVTQAVTAAMASLGLANVTSREQFKQVAMGLDLASAAGAKEFASLMDIQEAFSQVYPAIDQTAVAATAAADALAASNAQMEEANAIYQQRQSDYAAMQAAAQAVDVQRAAMELTLYNDTHTAAEQLAHKRELELAAMDASLRPLQQLINAAEDLNPAASSAAGSVQSLTDSLLTAAQAALTGLGKSIEAAKTDAKTTLDAQVAIINAQKAAAQTQIAAQKAWSMAVLEAQKTSAQSAIQIESDRNAKILALANELKSTLDGMQLNGAQAADRLGAQQQISQALSTAKATGMLPDSASLSDALRTVSQPSEDLFSSFTDYARDFYLTANDISSLASMSGIQLTQSDTVLSVAKDQLASLEALITATSTGFDQQSAASSAGFDQQIKDAQTAYDKQVSQFDQQMAAAQAQLDATTGTTNAVLSVANAMTAFQSAIGALASHVGAAAAPTASGGASAQGSVPTTSSISASQSANYWMGLIRSSPDYSAAIDAAGGYQASTDAWVSAVGAHENGGIASGWSIVGENGPELANFSDPARIYTAPQTRAALGAQSDNGALAEEVRGLREDNAKMAAMLEAHLYPIVKNTRNAADTLEEAAYGQRPLQTQAA
jgi:phage-related minor tail protein